MDKSGGFFFWGVGGKELQFLSDPPIFLRNMNLKKKVKIFLIHYHKFFPTKTVCTLQMFEKMTFTRISHDF